MNGLSKAIEDRRFKQARLLIDMELDFNVKTTDGRTILIQLCYLKPESLALNIAKALLAKGADIGIADKNGLCPLSHAVLQEKEELTAFFLKEAGNTFDLNHRDHSGKTALFHASTVGNFDILKMLLKELRKYRLSVDIPDNDGVTPLIQASKNGHLLCARYLVSEGKASKYIRDKKRFKTAEEWEQTKQSIISQQKFALFRVLFSGNHGNEDDDNNTDIRAKSFNIPRKRNTTPTRAKQGAELRPKTAPAILENCGKAAQISTKTKNKSQKEELGQVFSLYQCQLSQSFRVGCKYKPQETDISPDTGTTDCDSESKLSEESGEKLSWPRLVKTRRRGSLFINTSTSKLLKRGSLSTDGLNVFGGRRLSQSFPAPSLRRGSVSPEMMRTSQGSVSPGGSLLPRRRSVVSGIKQQQNNLVNSGRRPSQSSFANSSRRHLSSLAPAPVKISSGGVPTLSISSVIEEESEHDSRSDTSGRSTPNADIA